ncbi:DarT ssDNA thymidine ADP-ribosyltransferase family protein [Rhodopirellula baltica]
MPDERTRIPIHPESCHPAFERPGFKTIYEADKQAWTGAHLQADMNACALWANQNKKPIAFSTSNAGSFTADFYNQKNDLDKIDWNAVNARDFRGRLTQERKQAEFLMFDWFPWSLVEHVGVFDQNRLKLVQAAIAAGSHQPTIQIENSWYF